MTIKLIISIIVLIVAVILLLIGRMDLATAGLFIGLAVANLLEGRRAT